MLCLWCAVRRFGVSQNEVRPVDDYSEFGHNSTSHTFETVDAGGLDNVVGIARAWAGALNSAGHVSMRLSTGEALMGHVHAGYSSTDTEVVGRSLDLSRAYKQMARKPSLGAASIFAVWNPTSAQPELYEALAMAFGSRNAVLAFNWLTKALLFVMVREILLPATHFYDNFPILKSQQRRSPGDGL